MLNLAAGSKWIQLLFLYGSGLLVCNVEAVEIAGQ